MTVFQLLTNLQARSTWSNDLYYDTDLKWDEKQAGKEKE